MRSLCAVVVLLYGREVIAQPGDASSPVANAPSSPSAADLFAEGRVLLAAGKPAEACAKFTASLQLDPEAMGPILNLGVCNEQQDRLATALRWYKRAQTRTSELQIDVTELAAQGKLAALAERVPTLRIAFSAPPPASTMVTLDGAVVDVVDLARIELDAGHHVVDVAFASGRHVRRELDVIDGDAKTVDVDVALGATPDPVLARARAAHDEQLERARSRKHLAYVVGTAGLALLVADAAFGVVAKVEYDATESPYTQQAWQRALRYGGTSVFGVGVVAVGAAIALYVTTPATERAPRAAIVPMVGQGTVGIAAGGGF